MRPLSPGTSAALVRGPGERAYDALVTAPDKTPPRRRPEEGGRGRPRPRPRRRRSRPQGRSRRRRRRRPPKAPASKAATPRRRPRRRRPGTTARRERAAGNGGSARRRRDAVQAVAMCTTSSSSAPARRLLVRLLAGRRRLGRRGRGEEDVPREKTCGDGLTPRAVRQLADMGLEDALAGSHRYTGLRAFGFGQSIEMQWPEHPHFPDYGYTITRHDLDGLVAARAAEAGRDPAAGHRGRRRRSVDEAASAAVAAARRWPGVDRQGEGCDAAPRTIKARYVVVADGSNSRFGRMLGTVAPARPPARHGAARLLPLRPPRRPLHRVAPRHPRRRRQRGPRLRLDLPDGRRPRERRRRPPVDRAALEGRQHEHPHGHVRRLRARSPGASAPRRASGRRRAASCRWGSRSGPGPGPTC